MLLRFALMIGCGLFIISCDNLQKNNIEKMAITAKMKEKVERVSVDLKAYCDSEIYRKARWKADSILAKRALRKFK